ncbi:uncharacterized protein [Nicotiana tomentosiformis]|uniref:uncharacterized protein n=1 Tax=Nicotiana tomentosiformis TaxID=4098 RepID=UPI00388CBC1A
MQLEYYPPILKEGVKIVRLNQAEVAEQTQKWKTTLIGFNLEEDKNKIIQQGPYTYCNRPMILKQRVPNFQMSKEVTRTVPIWVIFPGLPIQFWTKENLGRIASYLGKPICSDKLTAERDRISYARMLIEMDIFQELPNTLLIEESESKYREQALDYEWKPSFCEGCFQIGQHANNCEKVLSVMQQKQTNEHKDSMEKHDK